tara:strand:+ start:8123 stop:10069 length:1947 start_codon:yes stop_codon:yes gene_type:complete
MQQEIAQAIAWFNQQQYQTLISFCEPRKNQHPMLSLLLATAYGKVGQFSAAEQLFLSLKQQHPANLDVIFNFALVLKLQQRNDEALQQLQQCLRLNNQYHPAHHAIGTLYLAETELALAETHLKQAVAIQPANPAYLHSLAELHYIRQDFAKARQQLFAVLGQQYHAPSLILLSAVLYKLKQTDAMRALCQRYGEQVIQQAEIQMYAGLIELDEKCYVRALKLLQQAQLLAKSPSFDIDANLLYCRYLLAAEPTLIQQIIELTKTVNMAQAWFFTANLLETLGELDAATSVIGQALAQFPADKPLRLINAKILTREKDYRQALAVLDSIDASQTGELLLDMYYLKARIYDEQQQYALAGEQIRLAKTQVAPVEVFTGLKKSIVRAIEDIKQPVVGPSACSKKLIFIVGFPRSGTTLLESRLARIAGVKVLEETHAAKQFYYQLLARSDGEGVMAFLNQKSPAQCAELAREYLTSLQQYQHISEHDVVVDKMPLNASYLAPLLHLFPDARVMIMLRHPLDVCISSLKQRMINLFSVDDFAETYDCYFSFLTQFKSRFAPNVMELRYEELVANYQQVFATVLQHCQLICPEGGATKESAAPTMFNTPSYHQVAKPLYTSSVQSYEHYQHIFNLQHPTLTRWCEQLGYKSI